MTVFLMCSEDPYYMSTITLEAVSEGERDLLCVLADANRLPGILTGMLLTIRTPSPPLQIYQLQLMMRTLPFNMLIRVLKYT